MPLLKSITLTLITALLLTVSDLHAQKEQETLIVFPNPMTDKATLEVTVNDNNPKQIVIYSIIGKELHRQQLLGTGHQSKFEVDFSFLNPGVYFLSLLSDNETVATKKIVKKQ
jgi:hypothetical protein